MWKFLSNLILKNRIVIIILIAMLTVFMIKKGKEAKLSYSMAKLLPESHQVSIDYNNFLEKYGVQNLLVIAVEDSLITTLSHLRKWDLLSDSIKRIYGVEQLVSFSNLPIISKDIKSKNFKSEKWFSDKIDSAKDFEKALEIYNKQPFFKGLINSENNKATTLLITLNDEIIRSNEREQLIFSIKNLVDNYASTYNIKAHYSGLPYIRTVDSIKVKKEISMFILFTLIITALILYLFFRSFKAAISSIIVVVIGVIFSFGSIVLLGYEITILLALVPPVLIVIGIPNCIFLINKFHSEFLVSNNKNQALGKMIQKIGNITLLTNLTTASGFAAFILTNSETLQEFGVVASLNILAIFLLSLMIIPIYFSFSPAPKKRHTRHLEKKWINSLIGYLSFIVQYKRKQIYLVTGVLIVIGFFGIIQLKTTGNITDDLAKDQALYKDLKFLEKNFGGVMPLEVLVDTKKKNGLLKSYNLRKINELSSLLSTYPEFSKSSSYIDAVKYSKQAFYNGDSAYYSLPNSQEQRLILSYLTNSNAALDFSYLLIDS